MQVERRELGDTGISVPVLSLGTVKFGRNSDVKYPTGFDLPDDFDVTSLLKTAISHGINLIDTAPAYGSSEERIGKLLTGDRKDWLICTKAGENYDSGKSSFDFTEKAIHQSIERSLSRLNTDYLDLVLVHSDGNDMDILNNSGALPALAALKADGKIRAIGMSTKTVEGGLAALGASDVVMVTYNPGETAERVVIEEAKKQGKGILVKKALASGHGDPEEGLQFALAEEGVSSVVLGTINPEHLLDNIRVATAS